MSQHPTDLFLASCGGTGPVELNVSGPGRAGAERRAFGHPFVLVGRHELSCLRLDDGEVSRRHAYLQRLGGRGLCVDLASRTGVRWGGQPRPAGWLGPGRGVGIGPFTLELATAARPAGDPGEGAADDWDPLRDRADDPRLLPPVVVDLPNGGPAPARWRMNRVLVLVGSSSACRKRTSTRGCVSGLAGCRKNGRGFGRRFASSCGASNRAVFRAHRRPVSVMQGGIFPSERRTPG